MDRPFKRSYWVVEGMLLAGYTPASLVHSDMHTRLQGLLDAGIRCYINLMEPDEVDYDGKLFVKYEPVLQQLAAGKGIELSYHNIPIVDRSIPSPETMRRILDTINSNLQQSIPVYVHCWGGKGRTGTVIGCWLKENRNISGEEAIAHIAELRNDDPKRDEPSPETQEQKEFVINWGI